MLDELTLPLQTSAMPAARQPVPRSWRRSVLEARWRVRLQQLTELSIAYHDAAATVPEPSGLDDHARITRQSRHLLSQAVAVRRALADTEEALLRLAAGRYGRCEQCAASVPPRVLALDPEARYCARCGSSRPTSGAPRQSPDVTDGRARRA
jgi:RNA polymerase-binding transcription factor DksA